MAGEKILIVDDDPGILSLIEFTLKSNGYETIVANDGRSGIIEAIEKKPDLILLDITMPDINGYLICEKLKKEEATRNIPIIMLTALDMGKDFEEALKKGADWYITKPFEKQHLLQRISYILETKKKPCQDDQK